MNNNQQALFNMGWINWFLGRDKTLWAPSSCVSTKSMDRSQLDYKRHPNKIGCSLFSHHLKQLLWLSGAYGIIALGYAWFISNKIKEHTKKKKELISNAHGFRQETREMGCHPRRQQWRWKQLKTKHFPHLPKHGTHMHKL